MVEELKFVAPNLIVPRCFPRNAKIEVIDTEMLEIKKKDEGKKKHLAEILREVIEKMDKLAKERKVDASVLVYAQEIKDLYVVHIDLLKVWPKK